MSPLPELYFRTRENGALVFRLDSDNRDRRLEYTQIAVVNTNRGDFKSHGDHELTEAEAAAIQGWLNTRMTLLENRATDDAARLADQINYATHWAQTKATDGQLETVTEDLLLAMHDLRNVLLRKKADRLAKAARN